MSHQKIDNAYQRDIHFECYKNTSKKQKCKYVVNIFCQISGHASLLMLTSLTHYSNIGFSTTFSIIFYAIGYVIS